MLFPRPAAYSAGRAGRFLGERIYVDMTTITGRCIKILQLLLMEERPITAKQLAEKMHISERTVRYDGVVLGNWLAENGFTLQKKPKVGYFLENKAAIRQLLQTHYREGKDNGYYYTSEERVFKIIGLVLSGESPILIQDIMDHLYVSKTTVLKDLATVRRWFSKRSIELRDKPNQGIRLQVDEQTWRRLVADWIEENVQEEGLSQSLLNMIVTGDCDETRAHEMLKYLDKILTIANFKMIRDGISEVCGQLEVQLSDTAFINLLIHIAIAMNRLVRNHPISMPPEKLRALAGKPEFDVVSSVFVPLMLKQAITLPQSEIGFITLHLLSAQRVKTATQTREDARVDGMIEIVLRHVQNHYRVNLRHHKTLVQGLRLHLQPALYRDEFATYATNPLLNLVQQDYPETCRVCTRAIEEINHTYGTNFDEHETGFIVVHVEAALKYYRVSLQHPQHVNVALVCASGLGTAKMLAANVRASFPQLRVVAELSAINLAGQSFESIDYIISTVRLPMPLPRPVIQVSAALGPQDRAHLRGILQGHMATTGDVQALMALIAQHCEVKNAKALESQIAGFLGGDVAAHGGKGPILPGLLRGNCSFLQQAAGWDDAVRLSCRPLVQSGAVLPAYADALIEAKNHYGQYSFIGPGICMPHAADFANVNKFAMAFTGIRQPFFVDAGDGTLQPVHILFTLAMKDSVAHLQVLAEINTLIKYNPEIALSLCACHTEQAVLDMLNGHLQGAL